MTNISINYSREIAVGKLTTKEVLLGAHIFNGKLVFTGFLDFWSGKYFGESDLVLLTEPQLWYNIDAHLAVGTEVEISNNFLPEDGIQVKPTLALKWNF